LPFRSGQALTTGYATFLSVIRLAYASLMPVPNVYTRLRVEERRQSYCVMRNGIKYDVIYKHLDKYPLNENGNFVHSENVRSKTLVAGQVFGELGTTGSSTGGHLHLEVQSTVKPDISPDYYEVMYGQDNQITGYLIKSDYFLRKMSKK
jgi:hypothetical protein